MKLTDIIKKLLSAIFNVYTDNCVAKEGEERQSEWRLINQGVRQGCSSSSLLFIIYINSQLNEWKQTNHGKVFISRNLNLDICYCCLQMMQYSSLTKKMIYNVSYINCK
jgi:hypothetical protein